MTFAPRVASWVMLILATIANLLGIYTALFIIPKFENIYKDLNIKLPDLTVMLIEFCHWYGWVLMALVMLGMVVWEIIVSGTKMKLWANGVYLVLALIFSLIVVIALFRPLITIV